MKSSSSEVSVSESIASGCLIIAGSEKGSVLQCDKFFRRAYCKKSSKHRANDASLTMHLSRCIAHPYCHLLKRRQFQADQKNQNQKTIWNENQNMTLHSCGDGIHFHLEPATHWIQILMWIHSDALFINHNCLP